DRGARSPAPPGGAALPRRPGSRRARSPPAPRPAKAAARSPGLRRGRRPTPVRRGNALLVGGERVTLLEVLPRLHGDALGLVDLHVRSLERQLVAAAGDLVVDDRGVLAGVLAVDPDLGP